MGPGPIELALSMAEIFDQLEIPYALGGSLASSIVGEPRSTVDIDIAILLGDGDIERLLTEVSSTFYVPHQAAKRAAEEHQSFNIIHEAASFKVDLFVLGTGRLDTAQIDRRVRFELQTDPPASLWVTSPEDQVLRKLEWFRHGGGVSDKQWRDVVAILRANEGRLDLVYLQGQANALDLNDLLDQAAIDSRSASGN